MVKEKKTAQLQCKIISRRKHIGRAILLFTVILYVVADFDQLGLDPVRDVTSVICHVEMTQRCRRLPEEGKYFVTQLINGV